MIIIPPPSPQAHLVNLPGTAEVNCDQKVSTKW
ncbi:hypothetical protein Syn6312_3771 (plasmid) [Synechococcus sp. PCC 6312]|nr:hypothetical protein Syn6312_3771 [Synechococcus sp. PCC 6312]